MRYITTLFLALPLMAIQLVALSMPVVGEQVFPRDTEVADTFKSVLTNWGHFGQTDFPHSPQPLATGPVHLAQLPTDARDSIDAPVAVAAAAPLDETLPPQAPKTLPVVKVNGNFVEGRDTASWPPFYSTDKPVNDCGDTADWSTSKDNAPNKDDCAALGDDVDHSPGFWNVTADPGRADQYILLTSHKSCGFLVMPWSNLVDHLIGSQDVRDLLNDAVNHYPNSQVWSSMSCSPSGTTNSWRIMSVA